MHAVVVGAGYTGQRVAQQLGPAQTTALRRADLDLDLPPVRPLALPQEFTLLYTVPPAVSNATDQRLINLFAALDALPKRIVYLSTSGVYGDRGGCLVTETDPLAPGTARSRARVIAEQTLLDWSNASGVPLFVLRVPGIYGPERLGLDRIAAALPVIAEAEANPGNRIHVDDLAGCCMQALTSDAPAGTYNVGDGDHRSSTWFAKTVAQQAGLPPPPEIPRAEAEKAFSEARLSFLRESRTLDTTKMRDVLRYIPRYEDPVAGIRASLGKT